MKNKIKAIFSFSFKDLFIMLCILSLTFVICYLFQVFIEYSQIYGGILFLLAVFLISRFTKGYLFGILSSIISSFILNYAFTPPYFKLSFSIPAYIFTFFIMLIVALLTSLMMSRIILHEKLKLEAEKERIRSNFLRSISHDLRTPLTSIITNARSLSIELSDLNDRENALIICEEAEKLLKMVENILSISKMNAELDFAMEDELVEELIETAVNNFKKRYEDAKTYVTFPDNIIFVNVNASLIIQVLFNLLENAYLHAESTIPIVIYVDEDKKWVNINVKDFGKGIDESVYEYLNQTQYFTNTNNDFKGIGLSVCSTIIKIHGGVIEARNNEDNGATFTVKLPKVTK